MKLSELRLEVSAKMHETGERAYEDYVCYLYDTMCGHPRYMRSDLEWLKRRAMNTAHRAGKAINQVGRFRFLVSEHEAHKWMAWRLRDALREGVTHG